MPDEGGPCTREIRVSTNDPNHPLETLVCEGSVLVPFRVDPPIVDIGHLPSDAAAQHQSVAIERGDGGMLNLALSRDLDAGLSAELHEIEPGHRYNLDITIGPPWPNGALDSVVLLETGVPESPQAGIRIIGRVDPRIRIDPAELVVPYLKEVRTLELKSCFTWLDGRSHRLLDARVDDPILQTAIAGEEGRPVLVLRVPPDYRQTAVARTITVHTDDEAMPVVTIPVTFAKPPVIAGDAPPS